VIGGLIVHAKLRSVLPDSKSSGTPATSTSAVEQ